MKIYDVGDFYITTRLADWQVRDMLAQDYDYEAPYVREVSEDEFRRGITPETEHARKVTR